MNTLSVENFGPISKASVSFGDLTLLVGPQASGKSIFLQLLKLLIDKKHIIASLSKYNYILNTNPRNILNLFFGEGMGDVWNDNSVVRYGKREYTRDFLLGGISNEAERLFYIPAQRILSISDGRPKNFMEFDSSTPYVLRNFSETLRLFSQAGLGSSNAIFPIGNRLKAPLKKSLNESIFHGGEVFMDEQSGQKKMKMKVGEHDLPFMTWSAGQKEFMPLLMGFYCLSGPPSRIVKKEQYQFVVMEEPEMGLHPKAIQSVILQILELLSNGYQVVVSTHSPVFIEFAWAFNVLQVEKKLSALKDIFEIKDNSFEPIFNSLTGKKIKTYFFSRVDDRVEAKDISSLDSDDSNMDISQWGGLSQFSGTVTDVVLRNVGQS